MTTRAKHSEIQGQGHIGFAVRSQAKPMKAFGRHCELARRGSLRQYVTGLRGVLWRAKVVTIVHRSTCRVALVPLFVKTSSEAKN